MSNRTIICLSTIDWNFAKQRHQILMELFACSGDQVIFVEHLGFSPVRLRNLYNIFVRILRAFFGAKSIRGEKKTVKNLMVITPLALPPQNSFFDLINKHFFLAILAGRLKNLSKNRPVIWTYLPTSTVANLIEKLSPTAVVYDCVYNALAHPYAPSGIASMEARILRMADVVITDARFLYNHKIRFNANTHQVPPGVDFKHFNESRRMKGCPAISRAIRTPRICFFGTMGREQNRVDLDILDIIARKRPQWSVVFIGPVYDMRIPDHLRELENIHWLGYKSYEELPSFLAECDVLIIPYMINDFSQAIFPAKVFECLATGKPVVATPLPELLPYREYIALADDPEDFLNSIEQVLSEDTDEKRRCRIDFARQNTWEERFEEIIKLLDLIDNK